MGVIVPCVHSPLINRMSSRTLILSTQTMPARYLFMAKQWQLYDWLSRSPDLTPQDHIFFPREDQADSENSLRQKEVMMPVGDGRVNAAVSSRLWITDFHWFAQISHLKTLLIAAYLFNVNHSIKGLFLFKQCRLYRFDWTCLWSEVQIQNFFCLLLLLHLIETAEVNVFLGHLPKSRDVYSLSLTFVYCNFILFCCFWFFSEKYVKLVKAHSSIKKSLILSMLCWDFSFLLLPIFRLEEVFLF